MYDFLGSPNVSAAVAFAIGIFIQLIEKLVIILKEHSHLEPQKPFLKEELEEAHIEDTMTVTLTKSVTPPSNDDVEKGESKEIVSKRKIKRKSSGPARRRRPLPAASNGLLGFSSSEEDDDSDDDESSDGGRRRRLNGGNTVVAIVLTTPLYETYDLRHSFGAMLHFTLSLSC